MSSGAAYGLVLSTGTSVAEAVIAAGGAAASVATLYLAFLAFVNGLKGSAKVWSGSVSPSISQIVPIESNERFGAITSGSKDVVLAEDRADRSET
jgi:hypothetical protein